MPVLLFWRNRRTLPLLLATLLVSMASAGPGRTSAAAPAVSPPCDYYASPNGGGDGLTSSRPFGIQDFWAKAAPGKTLCLLDGTYQGGANMILPPVGKSGMSGAPITVRALNDGAVFIDGQFVRAPFKTYNNSYWTFQGFDVGNAPSSASVAEIRLTNNSQFKRLCFSNTQFTTGGTNVHVLLLWDSSNNLYEDICAFGTGRNTIQNYSDGAPSVNNIYRRIWLRFEGEGYAQGSMTAQTEYFQYSDSTGGVDPPSGNDIWENIIVIYSSEQNPSGNVEMSPGLVRRWPSKPIKRAGWILYGYNGAASVGGACPPYCIQFFRDVNHDVGSPAFVTNAVDIFADARSQNAGTFAMQCTGSPKCAMNSADRLTGIRQSGAPTAIFEFANTTNTNECTSLGSCPNIYTGTPGTGSRACYQYEGGVLQNGSAGTTVKALWPWPMDSRIKAALTRAKNAGTGGSALAGVAGTGY